MINKKGSSIIELLAVLLIMGLIAAIAIPTTIGAINRNKKNAAKHSLNSVYESAQTLLSQTATDDYSETIVKVNDYFYYVSLTALIDAGEVKGHSYYPQDNEVFFCYNKNIYAIYASDEAPTRFPSIEEDSEEFSCGGVTLHWNHETNEIVY